MAQPGYADPPAEIRTVDATSDRIDNAFSIVDKHLVGRLYMLGDAFSIADLSLSGYLFYPAEESGYVLEELGPAPSSSSSRAA